MSDFTHEGDPVERLRSALSECSVSKKQTARTLAEKVRRSLAGLSSGELPLQLAHWYRWDSDHGVYITTAFGDNPFSAVVGDSRSSITAAAFRFLKPFARQFPGLRVLDLGCGDGSRSRFMAECGATVTAVAARPEEALTTAAMCANLPSVQVVLDSPHAVPFQGVFDLAVVGGHHEEFAGCAEALNPLPLLLGRAYAALVPSGSLLLAGHNALALRHFNDQRDAYGRDGAAALEGRFSKSTPRLWSASAMRQALVNAGFQPPAPCALLGSLTKPRLLVSPQGCEYPAERWNLESLVRQFLRDGDPNRLARFSESRVLSEIVQGGALAEWSDGYVFVAPKSGGTSLMAHGWLASAFQPTAECDSVRESRFVVSHEANEIAVEHYVPRSAEAVSVSPYINGTVYWDLLDDLMQVPGWTFEHVLQWTGVWLRCLLVSLNAEDALTPQGELAAMYTGNYDVWVPERLLLATPARWIRCADGSFQSLSAEVNDEAGAARANTVPLAGVLYAGVLNALSTVGSVAEAADSAWLATQSLAEAVVKRLGYPIAEADRGALAAHWQAVAGIPLPQPRPLVARQLPRPLEDEAKLYWAIESEGFSETKTSTAAFILDGRAQTLSLPISAPGVPVTALRFDVANRPGCFEVEAMTIMTDGDVLWRWDHTREALSGLQGVTLFVDQAAGRSCLLSRGNDPQFVINLPESVLASAAGGVLEVRLSAWPQRL